MPSFSTCSAPSAIELWWFLAVRKDTFRTKTFYACLTAITLCTALLPLFVTGTASFGAAGEECYAKTVVRLNAKYWDVDSLQYDPDWNEEDNFEDSADRHLFPTHHFNSISTVVSLFGLGVWLFFGPHKSDIAQDLDRTLGSYFALQWLANLLILAASLGINCNASGTADAIAKFVNILVSLGLSLIGTNLLCHRYLCEKARIMIKMYDLHSIFCVFSMWILVLSVSRSRGAGPPPPPSSSCIF
jgi:hypothetical protein